MCGRRVLANVELDTIDDGEPMPPKCHVVVVSNGYISACAQRRSECQSDFPLQCVTGNVAQLGSDRVETLALALPNLDGQQLE
jgi:hypothetical protein